MLFLGSCGLHVINGSLTTGHKAANWKVQVQLKSFFKLFKDSPARRADYIDFTGCNQFPKNVLFSKMGRKCRGLRKSARSIQAHQAVHLQSEKTT